MKRTFEITFGFLHTKEIGYFEMADLEELCKYEIKTKFVRAETKHKACNIIKHSFGTSVSIKHAREITKQIERTL